MWNCSMLLLHYFIKRKNLFFDIRKEFWLKSFFYVLYDIKTSTFILFFLKKTKLTKCSTIKIAFFPGYWLPIRGCIINFSGNCCLMENLNKILEIFTAWREKKHNYIVERGSMLAWRALCLFRFEIIILIQLIFQGKIWLILVTISLEKLR